MKEDAVIRPAKELVNMAEKVNRKFTKIKRNNKGKARYVLGSTKYIKPIVKNQRKIMAIKVGKKFFLFFVFVSLAFFLLTTFLFYYNSVQENPRLSVWE